MAGYLWGFITAMLLSPWAWRQTLVENAQIIEIGAARYAVRRASKHKLREVDFLFDGHEIRGC